MLARLRSLGLESLPGPVPTYYSSEVGPRAEALQRQVRDAVSFFESRYNIQPPLTLAVLNEPHWAAIRSGRPYGVPFFSAAPYVVFLPAFPDRAIVAQIFRMAHTAASPPEVGRVLTTLGVSHEVAVGRVSDLIAFHELGHVYVRALGFDVPHWLDEFMATYVAYTFLRHREPAAISMWNALSLDLVHGVQPATRKLDDFNRLYGPGLALPTYGWFESQFNLGVTVVLEQKQDTNWLTDLRAAGLDKGTQSLTTSELLDRLERITPGVRAWAERLEAGP